MNNNFPLYLIKNQTHQTIDNKSSKLTLLENFEFHRALTHNNLTNINVKSILNA